MHTPDQPTPAPSGPSDLRTPAQPGAGLRTHGCGCARRRAAIAEALRKLVQRAKP